MFNQEEIQEQLEAFKSLTPLSDFVKAYVEKDGVRLHMPGHKGRSLQASSFLSDLVPYDLTEIEGADSLYHAEGVIRQSEDIASILFGTRHTYFSAGGSSQTLKTMCALAIQHLMENRYKAAEAARLDVIPNAMQQSTGISMPKLGLGNPVIIAGRNAHKAFIQASQLLQFDIRWIPSESKEYSLCGCNISASGLDDYLTSLEKKIPASSIAGIYLTSPDYLGNMLDIKALAEVAHNHGTLLLVDNAHGAYLRFMPEDLHPITLGADISCDSAHKTLPVITGGSYLQISPWAPDFSDQDIRNTMSLFGSTSPSYLIMESLDHANEYLLEEASNDFEALTTRIEELKYSLPDNLIFTGDEKTKLTLDLRASGLLDGNSVAQALRERDIECEYADPDYLVTMWAPGNSESDFEKVEEAFYELDTWAHKGGLAQSISKKVDLKLDKLPEVLYQPYEILNLPSETIAVEDAVGRIAAGLAVSCPPAVTPVIAGEMIEEELIPILKHYGITSISVLK